MFGSRNKVKEKELTGHFS